VNFEISMEGDNLAAVKLGQYAARAAGVLEAAAHLIQEDFHALEARRFGDEGPGWAPLSPTTIAIKTRKRSPQPDSILYDTGKLLFSLTGNNEGSVFQVSADEIVMGTSVKYAQYHQTGPRQIRVFGRGSATLPQRKVVDITEEDAARWAAILHATLWAV
jgi:phage gpG-like protein